MRWAARLYRQAVRTPRARRKAPRLRVEPLEAREVPAVTGGVAGTVFMDSNLNGVQDADEFGVAGVTVKATDSTGATETATTGADGSYTLQTAAPNLRIQFSTLPADALPARVADGTGPLVRFLDTNSDRAAVNLALTAPQLVTTQFFYDEALTGINSTEGAVIAVPYGADSSATPTVLAAVADVGSVWGLAYQPSSNSLFASSFLKRHTGLGPNADATGTTTGGIYKIDPTGADVPSLLIDLNTAGAGLGAGADPHPDLPDPDGDWFHDAATLPLVGKRGLGGLAISADGRTLYTVNLATRDLIEIPLNPDGTRDAGRAIRHTSIPLANPAGSGITGFNPADLRPFAVVVKGGAVFVGMTYTAETSGGVGNLRAFVYAFDPAQGAFRTYNQATGAFITSGAPTPVLTANLNYPRGLADDPTPESPNSGDEVSATWRPWTSTFRTDVGQDGFPIHPSPWLTDIAFDGPNMVLGIRDRFGDQGGFQAGNTAAGSEDEFSVIAAGDILRAAPSGAGWQLESNGKAGPAATATPGAGNGQGPGGGEFYYQDVSAEPVPQEVVAGGLAQVPGFGTIAATGTDPDSAFSGGIYRFSNTTGAAAGRAALYESFDLNTFGSANGLGDLAAVPADGTVQVGDRVFQDTNGNGLQDAGEPGIAGVTLRLFQAGTEVDSVTTAAGGDYLFDNLRPNTAYQVRIDTTQAALAGRTLATTNQGADDQLDSDATLSGTTATIAFTTGDGGTSDHSLDAGFGPAAAAGTKVTIGNLVFRDANHNGVFDTGDAGISGVTVELLDPSGNSVLATTATGAAGSYTFGGRDPGTYRVRLATTNFNTGGPLAGFTPAAPAVPDPNANVDNDSNGTASGALGSGGFVVSGPVTVLVGGEPTTDGDDNDGNLTVDFGLVPPPTPTGTLTLGNLVFNDANNNGLFDAGEAGISGVTVQLLSPNGTVLHTTTTAAGGTYAFAGLTAGDYKVRLPAGDFIAGGPLFGFVSSTGPGGSFEGSATPDPDTGTDNDDNGTTSGTLGTANGLIETAIVSLSSTNQTVDLGVVHQVQPQATASVAGRVFLDFNNNGSANGPDSGVSGVTLTLSGAGLATPLTAQTDSAGNFTFDNLEAGTYTLTEIQPTTPASRSGKVIAGNAGGTANATSNSVAGITLAAGEAATGYSFAEVPLVSTGGAVYEDTNGNGIKDAGEPGVPGVTLRLTGTSILDGAITPVTATTNAAGAYTFTGLTPGTYAIAEDQPTAYTDGKESNGTPPAATVGNDRFAGIDLMAAPTSGAFNFGEVKGASLGGLVYADANNDGAKAAAAEPGIAGVKVRLTGTNDLGHAVDQTVTTGADGSYLFGSLRPGTYRLVETQPAGYADGKETTGTPAGTTTTNDQITGIALTSGTTATGFLFGEQPRADLALTQAASAASVSPGGTLTVTYTLKNKGTATATASTVTVNYGGLTQVSASVPAEFNSTTKTWTAGDLAAGATKTIRLTFRAPTAGTFAPTARAVTTAAELSNTNNKSGGTIVAGAVISPSVELPTPAPKAHGFLARLGWFLSSSTNARRGRR